MTRSQRSAWQLQTAIANPNLVSPSDELFFQLDGQHVRAQGVTWRLEVCGVYSTDQERWVQLNLVGSIVCGVTLRVGFKDADTLFDLVRDWLDDSLSSDLEAHIVSHANCREGDQAFSNQDDSPSLMM